MIFLSIFLIIALIFKKIFLLILKLIFIICYLLQYSGLVFEYFSGFKEIPYRRLGSIIEIIPYTVSGLIFASDNLLNKISKINKIKKKMIIILDCIFILYFIIKYDIFRTINGFRFPGVDLNVGGSCLFICFSFIRFKKKNKFLLIIKYLTNYTGGVYYLHIIIMSVLKKKISFITERTIIGGFIIYIISYFVCFIGMRTFGKTILKNLFY